MRPFLTVLPEKYNERNLMSGVMGVISDYVPLTAGRQSSLDEQVLWARFEDCDMNNNSLPFNQSFPLVLSIGTCKTFYFWGLTFDGKANLLFSEKNSFTIYSKLLPSPSDKTSEFYEKRPILALCDSLSRACCQWQVRFISLVDYSTVQTFYFESKAVAVDANSRFVLIIRTDAITVLDANSLVECFTIIGVRPTVWSNLSPKYVPYSLGVRWLAFADAKPVYHHLSRCGDASSDESQPLSSTVLNVNKRIWNSLTALASTVVAGSQTSSGQSCAQPEPYRSSPRAIGSTQASTGADPNWTVLAEGNGSPSSTSPGYVTIVDLENLRKRLEDWRKLETDTSNVYLSSRSPSQPNVIASPSGCTTSLSGKIYVNVHDHCEGGSVVAHFMANRWASVALIKFDPTGSLLFTACTRGHTFNLFRISSHPSDQRQTAVHHLYVLERGTMPCEVVDAAFSHDSRWLAVSTNHGTTHVFPITAYGGPITVRTHTRPYVVNRTSRYHRSSGLEEHHLTRPQRERSSSDMTSGAMVPFSSDYTAAGQIGKAAFGPGNVCRGAPMAGLSPQCPHLGVATFPRSPVSMGSGDSSDLSAVPTVVDGACACPLNARYNNTNPRLPPYPEPCHIRPEARLRPHSAGNTTTGAAVAALSAATGALEAVTTVASTVSGPLMPPSRQHMFAVVQHSGPCMHYPVPSTSPQFTRSPNQHQLLCYPLPIVEHPSLDACLSSTTGLTSAARFAPPLCFLPNRPRHSSAVISQTGDPYGSKARPVDGLFILTPDLHLVEYDLCVGPAETSQFGEKLYQEASIRLDCTPVGEWNLHTDAVFVPPFPEQHPMRMASSNLDQTSGTLPPPAGDSAHSATCPTTKDDVVSGRASPTKTKQGETPGSNVSSSKGLSPEDAASYWYSQVEVTTHLGPLRRVWMGPQFTFRPYSTLVDPEGAFFPESYKGATETDFSSVMDSISSSELYKFLPSCSQPPELVSFYGPPTQTDSETVEFSCGSTVGQSALSSRSSFTGATMLLPETGVSGSPSPMKPHPRSAVMHPNAGRLLDSSPRWRNSSGDFNRPGSGSIQCGTSGDSDVPIVIEGGSYQDSSFGGSMSSLPGRFGDDVASCIADAMLDDDSFWKAERDPNDPSNAVTPVGSTFLGPVQFTVRQIPSPTATASHSPVPRPSSIVVQSALSEADFPSQDGSPHSKPETVWAEEPSDPANQQLPTCKISSPLPGSVTEELMTVVTTEASKMSVKKPKRSKKSRSKNQKQSLTSSAGELSLLGTDLWTDPIIAKAKSFLSSPQSLGSSPVVSTGLLSSSTGGAYSDTGRSSPECEKRKLKVDSATPQTGEPLDDQTDFPSADLPTNQSDS